MNKEFKKPEFVHGILELRVEENGICIYATKQGLQRLSELCRGLSTESGRKHIHLEDYEVLTPYSLKCAIAIFDD